MAFIEKKDLKETYEADKQYSRQFHVNYDEYERLGDNKLPTDLAPELPPVNDGTLSGLLLEIAMRQLRQLQTGRVTSTTAPKWLQELVGIYWTRYIIPNATTQSSFFNKFFNGILRSDTHGSGWFFSFFVSRDGYSGGDFYLPYIKDVCLERGKVSDRECSYIWLDQYFTKNQIETIIEEAKEEDELAKKEGRKSDSPWNVPLLEKLIADDFKGSAKDARDQNAGEREQSEQAEYIKIVRLFHRGYGAPFYYFAPDLADCDDLDTDGCVGETTNKSPVGELPVTSIYSLENLTNPYGKGLVEMGGHIQNILDELVRNHILATQVGTRPPIDVHGPSENVNFDTLVWEPDAIWESGEADINPKNNTNQVYAQFVTVYGLYKTILLNLLGITDNTVSSESGSPQFSKTPQGVQAQQERTTIHDNFRAQNADTAFARLASNLINTTIANTQGSKVIPLLKDEIDRLNNAGFVDEDGNPLTTDSVELVWDNMRGDADDPFVFTFEVDPNSSQADGVKENDDAITEVLASYAKNPQIGQALAQSGWRLDIGELYKQYLTSKLPNTEKVITKLEPEGGQMGASGIADTTDPNEIAQIMQQYGIPQDAAQIFSNLRRTGMSDDQIVAYFNQSQEGAA